MSTVEYSVFEEAALSYLPYVQFYATFDETVSMVNSCQLIHRSKSMNAAIYMKLEYPSS